MHALTRSANSPQSLKIVCKPYATSCDTTLRCFHWLPINNSKTSIFDLYFRSSAIFPRSWSCRLTDPVLQSIPIYLKLQRPVPPPTHQLRFLLSTPPHFIVSTFFIHFVAPLGATHQPVAGTWLPWSSSSRLARLKSRIPPYLLIHTQPKRAV